MSSNRPMFDDEDLPAWLKNAGITYAGRFSTPSTPGGPPTGAADMWADSGPAEHMPWSSAEIFGASGQAEDASLPWSSAEPLDTPPAAAPADVSLPWSTEDTFAAPTAAPYFDTSDVSLPWSIEEAAAPADESMSWASGAAAEAPSLLDSEPDSESRRTDMPWMSGVTGDMPAESPDTHLPGTGELPWLDGPVQPAAKKPESPQADRQTPAAPPDKSGKRMTDYLPWRQGAGAAQSAADQNASEPMPWDNVPSAPIPAAPADDEWMQAISTPEDESQDLFGEDRQAQPATSDNWLDSFSLGDETPAQADDQDAFDFAPDANEATPLRRPGAPVEPPPEPTQPNRPTLRKRFAMPGQAPEPPVPASNKPAPAEETPDWLAGIELGGPASAPPPSAQPAQSAPADEPDWLAGTGDGLDFETIFGAKETKAPKSARPESTPAPTAADDEMLDWMAEPPPELNRAAPVAPAETPSWLSESVELPQSTAPGEKSLDWMEGGESDLVGDIADDWLSEVPPPGAPEPVKNDETDIPEWMRGMAPPEPKPAASAAPQADLALDWLENVEIPDELPPAPAMPPKPVPSAVPVPEGENLDLDFDLSSADIDSLLNLPPSGEPALVAEPEPELPPAPEMVNLDESIDFDQLLMIPEAEAEAPVVPTEPVITREPAAPAAPVKPARRAKPAAPPPVKEKAPAPVGPPAEMMPEWVSDMRPADAPVALHIGDQEVHIEQTPLARLNNQLRQLRERIKSALRPAPDQPAPESGPLSGIGGALPPATDVLRPAGGATATGAVVGDLQARRVTLLQNILSIQDEILRRRIEEEDAEPEAGAPAKARRKPAARSRFKPDRVLVTLILALVLIAPFFTSALNLVTLPTLSALPQEQRARFESVIKVVNNLQAKQPVLMAFEYGPTASGELDDLATAVLRDAFRVGAIPVIVSSTPSGAMHAQELLTRLAAEGDKKLVARQDYVILRYLPGGAAGVRALVDALQQPGFQRQVIFDTDIEGKAWSLGDVDLVATLLRSTPAFVLTETQDDVRNWAEQYRSTVPGETLRLALLSSASAAAAAQSYANSGASDQRILGPLVGLRDALIYQTERKQFTTDKALKLADQRWQSISVSALFAAVIILFGAALNMIRSLPRRRRTR